MHSLLDAILKDDFKSFREIFNTKLEEAIEAVKAGVRAESVSALGFALSESKCKKEEDGDCDKDAEPKDAESDDQKVIAEKGKVKKEEAEPADEKDDKSDKKDDDVEECDDKDGKKVVKESDDEDDEKDCDCDGEKKRERKHGDEDEDDEDEDEDDDLDESKKKASK